MFEERLKHDTQKSVVHGRKRRVKYSIIRENSGISLLFFRSSSKQTELIRNQTCIFIVQNEYLNLDWEKNYFGKNKCYALKQKLLEKCMRSFWNIIYGGLHRVEQIVSRVGFLDGS